MIQKSYLLNKHTLASAVFFIIGTTQPATAEIWTLEKSIQHAINGSPEQQEIEAGIHTRKYDLQQAGAWPNPTISLRAQNRLGLNDGTNGYNLDQITITQPLPLWRLQQQKAVAHKQLSAEQALAEQSLLTIQSDIARLYYALLFSHETLQLAEKRQHFTDNIVHTRSHKNSHVVRYINPLDRHRIELLHEDARRNQLKVRAAYEETLQMFRLRLQLRKHEHIELPSMHLAAPPLAITALQQRFEQGSATIRKMQFQLEAGEANIDLERGKRFNDPELGLIHERDVLAGRRQNFQGIMLSVSVPLWNRNEGNIARAEAESIQNRSRLQIAHRDLSTRLQQNHLHLTHLLKQASTFRKQMIEPAEHLLALTRQSYSVGEINSLSLIDAYNSYFNALNSHLGLIYQSNLVATDLYQGVGDSALFLSQTGGVQ